VRLLGVGVSGLADFTQEDLFAQAAQSLREADPGAVQGDGSGPQAPQELPVAPPPEPERAERWLPGQDVAHTEYGAGWVQGSGVGRVTVRFEVPADREPGRVRTFAVDDPALSRAEPPALTGPPAPAGRP
jgi:DNA polymerase-4